MDQTKLNVVAARRISQDRFRVTTSRSVALLLGAACLVRPAMASGPDASGAPVLTQLARFTGGNGAYPYSGLTIDAAGNLYGTTYSGGTNLGTVYECAAGTHVITDLAQFSGTNGANPEAGVTFDSAGNLYGTTTSGGTANVGIVYKIAAGTGVLSTVATFNGATGYTPYSGVTIDAAGDLFGTTSTGGAGNAGTIYEIPAGQHNASVLFAFNGSNGSMPESGLIFDSAGNLYGTTYNGGSSNNFGTVYEFSPGTHTLTTLASLNGGNGGHPFLGNLVFDSAGDLFGTAPFSAVGAGQVFEIAAGTHAFSNDYGFTNTNGDGALPYGGLIIDAAGNLFGTTFEGGTSEAGTVFELPAGTHTDKVLASTPSAAGPYDTLVADSAGNLYGTSSQGGAGSGDGDIFEVTNSGYVVPVPEPAAGIAIFAGGAIAGIGTRRRTTRE